MPFGRCNVYRLGSFCRKSSSSVTHPVTETFPRTSLSDVDWLFLQAVIQEVQRLSCVAPQTIPHRFVLTIPDGFVFLQSIPHRLVLYSNHSTHICFIIQTIPNKISSISLLCHLIHNHRIVSMITIIIHYDY